MNLPKLPSLPALALSLVFLVPLFSCGKPAPEPSAGNAQTSGEEAPAEAAFPAFEDSRPAPFALLRTGENPLWFEFSDQGPRLIDSPGEAETAPFVPWPLARHVREILSLEGEIFFAVNRDGLLALSAWKTRDKAGSGPDPDAVIYRIPGDLYWRTYTVAALFPYRGRPALLFYRDDHFSDLPPNPPDPPVLGPAADFSGFAPLEIPALEDIPFAEGWEADLLRPGADGYWYYRGLRRVGEGREIRYFRTADLSQRGEGVSPGAFRASQTPAEAGTDGEDGRFLPVLPEGFAYTGFAWAGDTLFAAWEEQEDYNIGAAGFMAVKPPRNFSR
jgi:hypothetical protein